MLQRSLLTILLLVSAVASADGVQTNEDRAHFNYQLFCQGCHGPEGDGGKGVPIMKNSVGQFLNSQAGREYLVRVPGAANSPLTDEQLSELLNWTIKRFAGSSAPAAWQAYTAAEVGTLRQQPLLEVLHYRQDLVSALNPGQEPQRDEQ